MAKSKKHTANKNAANHTGISASSAHALMETAEAAVGASEEEETKKEPVNKEGVDEEKETLLKIVKRLMDDMGAGSLAELSDMIDRAEERKLVSVYGLSEEGAKLFLSQQEKVRALRAAEAAAAREAVYADMRHDPLYDDVDEKKEMVERLILKTGISPKEAYFALFAEDRLRRLLKAVEGKEAEAEKKAKHIPALSGGNAPSEARSEKLSETEKRFAEKAGITPEEYAKYKFAY